MDTNGPAPLRIDHEQNFQGAGPDSGEVVDIAIDPRNATDNVIYIATNDGGIWKSTDGGTSWKPETDYLLSLSMGAVTLDRQSIHCLRWYRQSVRRRRTLLQGCRHLQIHGCRGDVDYSRQRGIERCRHQSDCTAVSQACLWSPVATACSGRLMAALTSVTIRRISTTTSQSSAVSSQI